MIPHVLVELEVANTRSASVHTALLAASGPAWMAAASCAMAVCPLVSSSDPHAHMEVFLKMLLLLRHRENTSAQCIDPRHAFFSPSQMPLVRDGSQRLSAGVITDLRTPNLLNDNARHFIL